MFYDRNPESMRTVPSVCAAGRDSVPRRAFFFTFFSKIRPRTGKISGSKKVSASYVFVRVSSDFSVRGRIFEKKAFFGTRNRTSAETESRPAAQTLGTVRMLSGLRSWTSLTPSN